MADLPGRVVMNFQFSDYVDRLGCFRLWRNPAKGGDRHALRAKSIGFKTTTVRPNRNELRNRNRFTQPDY